MKVKVKHNKKRNTAFLYEALVRRVTKCVLEEERHEKGELVSLIRRFFSKGSPLSEELSLYQAVLEAERKHPIFIERVMAESKSRYIALDKDDIFSEQSRLISKINRKYGKDFYETRIPNYRHLATISAIFNNSLPVKHKVLLERNLVNELTSAALLEQEHELMGSPVLFREVMKKFNTKYVDLFEEQKCLLNAFMVSLSDEGLSLKAFLNEELVRLRGVIEESLELPEVKSDPIMLENTQQVLKKFEHFRKVPVDPAMLEQVLKIQRLAREVQT